MIASTRRCLAIVVVALFAAGCHKKVKPAKPAPIVLPKNEPQPDTPPPNLPAAPKVPGQSQSQTPAPPVTVEVKPPPPAPPATKKAGRTPSKKGGDIKAENRAPEVRIVEPKPDPAKPEGELPPTSSLPALGEILSPEQTREYTRRFDEAVARSRRALIIIESKTLNPSQKQAAARIRGFIEQAVQTRPQDVANAASLAERADVLSKDLLSRLQ